MANKTAKVIFVSYIEGRFFRMLLMFACVLAVTGSAVTASLWMLFSGHKAWCAAWMLIVVIGWAWSVRLSGQIFHFFYKAYHGRLH